MREKNLLKISWNKEKSETELLIRKMKFQDPRKTFLEYSKDKLKEVFLRNYFRFSEKEQNFWKIVLDISEKELTKYKSNFKTREFLRIQPYPL